MRERLLGLRDRVLEWWNRFTIRQKTLIGAGLAAVAFTVIILVTVFNQPQYVPIATADSLKQSNEIIELFDENGIRYRMSDDALKFDVLAEDKTSASLLLATNNIQAEPYSIDNVTNGSFSTTESDKQKKYIAYLEDKLGHDFSERFDAIDSAKVELHIPTNDGTLLSKNEESSASIFLRLKDPEAFTEDNAAYLAKATATILGNNTTEKITIMDSEGNMLFSGSEDTSAAGLASTQLTAKTKAEAQIRNEIIRVLRGTKLYNEIEVASNLVLDFSNIKKTTHTYTPAEGQTQGVLSHEDSYNANNVNGTSGIPGTDTNNDDETSYMLQDNENSSSTIEEESKDYLPNEEITTVDTPSGKVNYEESSISVTATTYVVYNEDNYNPSDHNDMTWKEFKENTGVTQTEVSEDTINIVAKASGISAANISMTAYNQPEFFDAEPKGITFADLLQLILILLILGLLGFVIWRSITTRKEEIEIEEQEEEVLPEELSVEELLESQPEEFLEDEDSLADITMEESSETMKLIEKFIEENPEAAAILLRNWLKEDYEL
ncbi:MULTISPECIES: flagellar M-ring protein FliF C-terminal domain-containing protein [unclassified Butyrivibrio]|uniref:flagellar M-ring protein FliF C-terminal domain-containing protein n=1 Tax=unclassified Butyrivibrio TaxID=2639466 RepID=UPI000412FDF5|nr:MULTISPECIES: flagellar M-ring protein FliF C-terminal domain-containing protein [unclassified Butyrivibrio]